MFPLAKFNPDRMLSTSGKRKASKESSRPNRIVDFGRLWEQLANHGGSRGTAVQRWRSRPLERPCSAALVSRASSSSRIAAPFIP